MNNEFQDVSTKVKGSSLEASSKLQDTSQTVKGHIERTEPSPVFSLWFGRVLSMSLICRCGRRRPLCIPDSWRSNTNERCNDTFLSFSQSSCCVLVHSIRGRTHQCRESWHCISCLVFRKIQSQGWAHKSSESSRSKWDPSRSVAWRRYISVEGSQPTRGILDASPQPSPKRCHTCPWDNPQSF